MGSSRSARRCRLPRQAIERYVAQHDVDTSISRKRVVRVLNRVAEQRSLLKMIRVDEGPEFTSLTLHAWARARGIKLAFIQPGKPMQTAYIESFNERFRDECLKDHRFTSLNEALVLIEAWRQDYNLNRPHSSLGNITPSRICGSTSIYNPGPTQLCC
jgi:putative transposase